MNDPAGRGLRGVSGDPKVVRLGLMIAPGDLKRDDGRNINGPSIIRVPSWVRNPLGTYYMYFAHHAGRYIRLAYADEIAGPWRVHRPGTLSLKDCSDFLSGHIASPDAIVDEASRRIRLYFHGHPVANPKTQSSFVALSSDGIRFAPQPEILGTFYFRAWKYRDRWYALGKARLYRSRDGLTGWEEGHLVYSPRASLDKDQNGEFAVRHTAVHLRGDRLDVYFSRAGDMPECILRGQMNLAAPWEQWTIEDVEPVLKPEEDYEGAGLPLRPSRSGRATKPVNQLRDPCIYAEAGRLYLAYAVAGEQGIALAEIVG